MKGCLTCRSRLANQRAAEHDLRHLIGAIERSRTDTQRDRLVAKLPGAKALVAQAKTFREEHQREAHS